MRKERRCCSFTMVLLWLFRFMGAFPYTWTSCPLNNPLKLNPRLCTFWIGWTVAVISGMVVISAYSLVEVFTRYLRHDTNDVLQFILKTYWCFLVSVLHVYLACQSRSLAGVLRDLEGLGISVGRPVFVGFDDALVLVCILVFLASTATSILNSVMTSHYSALEMIQRLADHLADIKIVVFLTVVYVLVKLVSIEMEDTVKSLTRPMVTPAARGEMMGSTNVSEIPVTASITKGYLDSFATTPVRAGGVNGNPQPTATTARTRELLSDIERPITTVMDLNEISPTTSLTESLSFAAATFTTPSAARVSSQSHLPQAVAAEDVPGVNKRILVAPPSLEFQNGDKNRKGPSRFIGLGDVGSVSLIATASAVAARSTLPSVYEPEDIVRRKQNIVSPSSGVQGSVPKTHIPRQIRGTWNVTQTFHLLLLEDVYQRAVCYCGPILALLLLNSMSSTTVFLFNAFSKSSTHYTIYIVVLTCRLLQIVLLPDPLLKKRELCLRELSEARVTESCTDSSTSTTFFRLRQLECVEKVLIHCREFTVCGLFTLTRQTFLTGPLRRETQTFDDKF
ncbi:hypothetical protein Pcinc_015791 [Petrolisthes cinctipes]|uniref:Gustatory receptor n=1 Tax=Petrolisthes cinctipes TaxID=88211 RepID=A0AAE1FUZ3_PETCI|nr:hypothetical protein Pcinc_015791 [Petrolisthes cinctipes]